MSYATHAYEYKHIPRVETVAVWLLDANGEPKSERLDGVKALFAEETTEDLSGRPIGVGGNVTRAWVFTATLPQGATLAPFCKLERADGSRYHVANCQLRVFSTRYVCDLRREMEGA